MIDAILLGGQAALTLVSLVLLYRTVAPALGVVSDDPHADALVDVWLPIVLAVPLILAAFRIAGSVRGPVGWSAVAGPTAIGALALLIVIILAPDVAAPRRHAGAWLGGGLLLLLLAAAHDMSMWLGQCVFATGAVLMWLMTPPATAGTPISLAPRAGWGALLMLFLAAGQGTALAFLAPPPPAVETSVVAEVSPLFRVGLGLALAQARFVAILILARRGKPDFALRTAGWTATSGLLFGVGLVALARLIPESRRVLSGESLPLAPRVAWGLGAYALEAVLLLLAVGLAITDRRIPRRTFAGVVAVVAVGVVVARMLG